MMIMDVTKIPDADLPNRGPFFGKRYIQFLLLCAATVISYGNRTILSVTILAMTEKNPPNSGIPTYPKWDNTDMILSSFFWGYFVPQIVAGLLSEKFGPKWFLFGTMIIGAISNSLIPYIASTSLGSSGVIACRVIFGLNQGFLYPSIYNLLSRWAPLSERSKTMNFVTGGASLGIVICMPIAGAISSSSVGWPVVFYFYGGLAVFWGFLWVIFGSDGPDKHPTISEEERKYLETHCVKTSDTKGRSTPWKSIFTSVPVWAMLIAVEGQCWSTFSLLTEIPSYLEKFIGFDISNSSLLSALPYLASWIGFLLFGLMADKLITSKTLSVTWTRKLCQIIGCMVPAAAVIWLAFIDKSQKELAVALLVVATGATAALTSGCLTNQIDLAPNYAGTLMGISNFQGQIFSIFGPLVVGFMGTDKSDPELWKKVYLLMAAILTVTCTVYVIFSSGEVQPWNDSNENKEKKGKENV